jgi:hypothetical protein
VLRHVEGGGTHGTWVTPNDSETINPQSKARYTIDFSHCFGSDDSLEIRGAVSPTLVALSVWMAMAKVVQHWGTKVEDFLKPHVLLLSPTRPSRRSKNANDTLVEWHGISGLLSAR